MAQTEDQILKHQYAEMYRAMIAKDTIALGDMMSEESALIHMTGMRQPKKDYLYAIADGALNYYKCAESVVDVRIEDDRAFMTGRSKVEAAVFGGSRHTWLLRLDIDWKKVADKWIITEIRASTY